MMSWAAGQETAPRSDEELNDVYCAENIRRVIKRGRGRLAGYVARTGAAQCELEGGQKT